MKKTMELKKEFLDFTKEMSYTAFSELCEILGFLCKNQQFKKLSISYTKTDIGMNFLFESYDESSFNVNLTKGFFMEALIVDKDLDEATKKSLLQIGDIFMKNILLNSILSDAFYENINKKRVSVFSEMLEITPENIEEQIKKIMGSDYERYEKEYLNEKISQSLKSTKKIKV